MGDKVMWTHFILLVLVLMLLLLMLKEKEKDAVGECNEMHAV